MEEVDFLVGHEVQAVAAEEPQQVARHQVGDLRVAVEDLADQVLAKVQAAFRVARQFAHQLVEAFDEEGVVLFRHLLGLAQGDQDAAQMGEQGEVVVEVGIGHGGFPEAGSGAGV
ncbi:hypothetical protein D3C85_1582450 [compost metagenome]